MNCRRCNEPLDDASIKFCPICGASTVAPPEAIAPIEAVAAPPPEPPPSSLAAPGPALPANVLSTSVAAFAAPAPGARCALHPDTSATDICARCGAFACIRCLKVDLAGRGVCEACFVREGSNVWDIPWEKRSEIGLFRGYWETTRETFSAPTIAFSGLKPTTGKLWDPISYAIVSAYFAFSGSMVVYALIAGVAGLFVGSLGTSSRETGLGVILGISLAAIVGFALLIPVAMLLRIFLLGGLEHLLLSLFGGVSQEFEATVRAHCYSTGPSMIGLVPFCGAYVFPIWEMVLRILALKAVHRTTGGKAAAAVLSPFGVCCGVYMLFVVGAQVAGRALR